MTTPVAFCRICKHRLDADRAGAGFDYCGKACRGVARRLDNARAAGDDVKYAAAARAAAERAGILDPVPPSP